MKVARGDHESREKLSEKKLINLYPTQMGRLKRVAAMRHEDEVEIIRRGLDAELDRCEAMATVESERLAKLQKLATAKGADVDVLIDRMLEEATDPELPLAATGTGGGGR